MKRYQVKEIFHSIQGEGVRAGIPHIFIRFAGCNLDCNDETTGWHCDTDFVGGTAYTLGELIDEVRHQGPCDWVLFTGGEPALQLDRDLVAALHGLGYQLAVETNGTRALPANLDWVCVSPKYEPPVIDEADEVKYVLAVGQQPETIVRSRNRLVSPAFEPCDHDGDCEPPACPGYYLNPDTVKWCVEWVKTHPGWRLSVQTHKFLGIR